MHKKMAEKTIPPKNPLDYKVTIPKTAKAIKVVNIQNPYIMRAYDTIKHKEEIDKICRQLRFINKETLSKKNDEALGKVGDVVFIQSSNRETGVAELPAYYCRGLITHIKKKDMKYNILLVDYGISVELVADEFHVIPKDIISKNYLTRTIGMYNILPIRMRRKVSNGYNSMAVVVEEWSEEAIHFAKELLIASEEVYFDHLITDDQSGREYGEFYLIIDDVVIPLSEALVINYYAIYLDGDLLQLIETPNLTQHEANSEKEVIIQSKFSINRSKKAVQLANQINDSIKNGEKILIQSQVSCEILNNVNDLNFPQGIHKGWNKCIKSSRPRKLQSYIWPAIKQGLNVVAIGSSQSGKSSGCVMAICGLIAMRQNELSRSATHPLALILCASSVEVINVHSLCTDFLETFGNIKAVAALNGKTNRSIAAMIYNGCQILVATPRYLVRFLNECKNVLSFEKLSYLVLDNADLILDKYYNSVGELFKKHKVINNREPQGDNRPILQMIVSARRWTFNIKKFVSVLMYNSYICVASFIEAVIFKSVRPKTYGLKSTCKNQKILDMLKSDYTKLRTMIVCINAEEAEQLNTFLCLTKKTLLIHENMELLEVQAARNNWNTCIRGLYPVLICTDDVLSQLNLTNIEWLIHHSVLLSVMNKFNFRFSVLLDNLIKDATICKISIIIDENNDLQCQRIVKLMQRMNAVISPNLLECIERIAITLEKNKKEYDICDGIKSLGFCSEQNGCAFRHCILPEIDAPTTNMQMNDKVKLMVLYIHDTTHFSARVLEHIPHSNNLTKITFSNTEYMQVTDKIQKYYQNIENRKMCTSTNIGDICVLEESVDIFKRVKIRCIRHKNSSEEVKFVDVRYIDSGIIAECIDIRKLMYLPEELLNLPTHVVEIFLTDLAPCDEEYNWNLCTNQAAHKWFSENLDEKSYIIGKVRLHLGNTIWLDDLEVETKLVNHNEMVVSSLKKELIAEKFAVPNKDHIPRLLQWCKNGGLSQINGYDLINMK